MDPWRLFYDGECNLCHGSKMWAERWAERAGVPLIAAPLQGDEARAKGYGGAMTLEAERVYYAAEAWLRLCQIGPVFVRWLPIVARIPGARWLIGFAYRAVERYRYRLFGRRSCDLPR